MNISRALLAAALQLLIAGIVTTNIVPILTPAFVVPNPGALPGDLADTIRTTVWPTSRILIGMFAAFIAGWWGVSGQARQWLQQGLLIGALVAFFGVMLAIIGDAIGVRTTLVLLDLAAALAGAAVASFPVSIRRAFIAAGVQFSVTIVLSIAVPLLALMLLREVRGPLGEAEVVILWMYLPWLGLLLSMTTAFLSGWWGARGLGAEAVRHGLLIGVLAVGLFSTWIIILGEQLDWLTVLFMSPAVAAAAAGAAFARSRHRPAPA